MDWKIVISDAFWHVRAYLADHAANIPYVIAASKNGAGPKLDTSKILETLIGAGIIGLITMYGIQQRLNSQMEEQIKRWDQLESRQAIERAEVMRRLDEQRKEAIDGYRRLEDRINSIHPARVVK